MINWHLNIRIYWPLIDEDEDFEREQSRQEHINGKGWSMD